MFNIFYKVKVLYFEVYNEYVWDLFVVFKVDVVVMGLYYLKIREFLIEGLYVKDLMEVGVGSLDEIFRLMRVGDGNRMVVLMRMNDIFFRSYVVFMIMFK